MHFNEAQQRVIDTTEGTVLVISCPGSGKTTVLINRIKKLINMGVSPSRILVTTFTRAAASDMTNRLNKLGVAFEVKTIHSIATRIVMKTNKYGVKGFYGENEKREFFRNYLTLNFKGSFDSAAKLDDVIEKIIGAISYARNTDRRPSEIEVSVCSKDVYLSACKAFQEEKKSKRLIDYDDAIWLARNTLRNYPDVSKYWQEQYDYIMVDEYQDTNKIQAEIFNLLAKEHKNICVVGDDDQAMYSFRGADTSIMLHFADSFPACKKILMDTNYRSLPDIVKYADNLICNNESRYDKELKANRTGKANISVIHCDDTMAQAIDIANQIQTDRKNGVPYNEIAVLYRTNAQSAAIVQEFMANKIPFYSNEAIRNPYSSVMFFDFLRYYRIANGTGTSDDFLKCCSRPNRYLPKKLFVGVPCNIEDQLKACEGCETDAKRENAERGIIKFWKQIEQLKKKKSLKTFMKYINDTMKYGDCLENFANFTAKDPKTLQAEYSFLIDESAKYKTMDEWVIAANAFHEQLEATKKEMRKTGVCLSTFHQSKGLEWTNVYMIDCIDGITPHKLSVTNEEREEERRMFYVGFTRAKDKVQLYVPNEYGGHNTNESGYIDELDIASNKKISVNVAPTKEEIDYAWDLIYHYYENKKDVTEFDKKRAFCIARMVMHADDPLTII